MRDDLIEVEGERCDVGVRKIFVAGHIGVRNAELDDLGKLGWCGGGFQVVIGPVGKVRGEAVEIRTPLGAGGAVGVVAGGAFLRIELLSVRDVGESEVRLPGKFGAAMFCGCGEAGVQSFEISDQVVAAGTSLLPGGGLRSEE